MRQARDTCAAVVGDGGVGEGVAGLPWLVVLGFVFQLFVCQSACVVMDS